MPTASNAGGAWFAYSAKAGIKPIAAMPVDAPIWLRKNALYTEPGLIW